MLGIEIPYNGQIVASKTYTPILQQIKRILPGGSLTPVTDELLIVDEPDVFFGHYRRTQTNNAEQKTLEMVILKKIDRDEYLSLLEQGFVDQEQINRVSKVFAQAAEIYYSRLQSYTEADRRFVHGNPQIAGREQLQALEQVLKNEEARESYETFRKFCYYLSRHDAYALSYATSFGLVWKIVFPFNQEAFEKSRGLYKQRFTELKARHFSN